MLNGELDLTSSNSGIDILNWIGYEVKTLDPA